MSPRDVLLWQIGRNVLNFQYLEAALRNIIPALSAMGTLSELPIRQAELVRQNEKVTLGTLAKAFHKTILQPSVDIPADHGVSEPAFAFSLRVEASPEVIANWKLALENLIAERNQLIHHELLAVDLKSIEQCQEFSAKLDEQNVRLCAHISQLKALRSGMIKGFEEFSRMAESEEFWKSAGGGSDDADP